MKDLPIFETEKGVQIGYTHSSVIIAWSELGDVITILQNLDQDHNSSENLQHEYESL